MTVRWRRCGGTRRRGPRGKVTIVTAEDAGSCGWRLARREGRTEPGVCPRATGDYLWQVDIDEFYLAADMERVLAMLAADPAIDAMTFAQITFWGGLDYVADGWYLRRGAADYHRLFNWGPGFDYRTHRPPTVLDETGRDLRTGRWLDAATTASMGIRLYHYSLLLPKQVIEKCDYYATADWARRTGAVEWANEAYLSLQRPFRVHNVFAHPSWLERQTARTRRRSSRWSLISVPGMAPTNCAPRQTSSDCSTRAGTGAAVGAKSVRSVGPESTQRPTARKADRATARAGRSAHSQASSADHPVRRGSHTAAREMSAEPLA